MPMVSSYLLQETCFPGEAKVTFSGRHHLVPLETTPQPSSGSSSSHIGRFSVSADSVALMVPPQARATCPSTSWPRVFPSRWKLAWSIKKCSLEFGEAPRSWGRSQLVGKGATTLIFQVDYFASLCFHGNGVPVASSSLHNAPSFLFPCLASQYSSLLLPGIPFRINYLHASLFLRLCVWETQTRIVPNIAVCRCEKHYCNFTMALRFLFV